MTCSSWKAAIAYAVVLDEQAKVKAIEGTEKLKERPRSSMTQVARGVQNEIGTDRLKTKFEHDPQISRMSGPHR